MLYVVVFMSQYPGFYVILKQRWKSLRFIFCICYVFISFETVNRNYPLAKSGILYFPPWSVLPFCITVIKIKIKKL